MRCICMITSYCFVFHGSWYVICKNKYNNFTLRLVVYLWNALGKSIIFIFYFFKWKGNLSFKITGRENRKEKERNSDTMNCINFRT
jgi:hypothetical protein